jgi:hypothetical protein
MDKRGVFATPTDGGTADGKAMMIDAMLHTVRANSCGEAWLEASRWLSGQQHRSTFNMIVGIEKPTFVSRSDFHIVQTVDKFLEAHDKAPTVTVAGTIFPAGLYKRNGNKGVYEMYPQVYEEIKAQWGTYAMRMIQRNGIGGEYHPLRELVEKIRTHKDTTRLRSIYEIGTLVAGDLPIYDPESDRSLPMGQPCLSHLTFKIIGKDLLTLTVLYRSHYYVERALGNFIGLAHLLAFVANETDLQVGPLVCHSSYARLESGSGWTPGDVLRLLDDCSSDAGRRDGRVNGRA